MPKRGGLLITLTELVVDSFQILSGLGVDPDLLTLLDENGDADLQAGLGGDVLGSTLYGIALDGFFGLGYQEDYLRGDLNIQELCFPEGAAVGLTVFHQELVVREVSHRDFNLLEGIGQHQVEVLPIVVQILTVPVDHGDVLGVVLCLHGFTERLAGGRALQLQANEGRSLAGIHKFTVDAYKGLSFDQ